MKFQYICHWYIWKLCWNIENGYKLCYQTEYGLIRFPPSSHITVHQQINMFSIISLTYIASLLYFIDLNQCLWKRFKQVPLNLFYSEMLLLYYKTTLNIWLRKSSWKWMAIQINFEKLFDFSSIVLPWENQYFLKNVILVEK